MEFKHLKIFKQIFKYFVFYITLALLIVYKIDLDVNILTRIDVSLLFNDRNTIINIHIFYIIISILCIFCIAHYRKKYKIFNKINLICGTNMLKLNSYVNIFVSLLMIVVSFITVDKYLYIFLALMSFSIFSSMMYDFYNLIYIRIKFASNYESKNEKHKRRVGISE